ncbi:hypothetical protein G4V72_04400 [Acinetobacter sp. GC2]|uniref:hypothetical protein n=1 Tax=Acinetobacter lwoffii TaxID=28090 RepID=UPI0013DE9B46|nr:hypothetical protein [Acinetobacter lwoffii]NGP40980.1 hypothetical protein [Acinetobacter lwoffii]
MDIQKEREAFEKLIDIEIIISEGFKFNPNINQYYHPDHTNHRLSYAYLMGAWMVWREKAQAVPEGYVLMPIKPTKTMVMAVAKEHEGDAFLPYSLYDAYVKQAMIEAQEPAND